MKKGLKILAAYDGSDDSMKALSEAIDLCKAFSGSITLLNCPWEVSNEEAMSMLKETENPLKEASVKYDLKLKRTENAPEGILGVSNEDGFDIIVIGSRGVGGTRPWLMGSVSNKVAAEAKIPVLVVK
jgi:nucleotide-binding universal stress UspA family protein